MAPKKAPPRLSCLRCAPKRRPWPLPPDLMRLITVHLYLPNGEFVIEAFQRHDQSIDRFLQDLENGDITPDMDLELGDLQSMPCYGLVFNDIVLEECWDWTDVPGVSFTEPNIITVVRYERPVHAICTCGLTLPRRRDT